MEYRIEINEECHDYETKEEAVNAFIELYCNPTCFSLTNPYNPKTGIEITDKELFKNQKLINYLNK